MQHRRIASIAAAGVALVFASPSLARAQSCASTAVASPRGQSREAADGDAQFAIENARRFTSDFEKCRALGRALGQTRRVETASSFFDAAGTLRGEFELAEVLIAAAQRGLLEGGTAPAFFRAAEKITADFQLRRVLSAALRAGASTPAIVSGILHAAPTIEQDDELASLLVEIAGAAPLTGALRDVYIEAAKGVQSEWEHNRVMQALASQRERGTVFRSGTGRE